MGLWRSTAEQHLLHVYRVCQSGTLNQQEGQRLLVQLKCKWAARVYAGTIAKLRAEFGDGQDGEIYKDGIAGSDLKKRKREDDHVEPKNRAGETVSFDGCQIGPS